MKRPRDEPDHVASTPLKRSRPSAPLKAHYRQPGDLLLPANPQDPAVLDGLVDRTITTLLLNAGFDAINQDALESLRNTIDSYMHRLTQLTRASVASGRRYKVQPQDVEFALRHAGVRFDSLLADANPVPKPKASVVRKTTQFPLPVARPSVSTANDFAFDTPRELSEQLGSSIDKISKKWIPRHFPAFPPPHAYKSTSIPLSARETDARKVREQATEEGVQAERALRKLVGAKKTVSNRAGIRSGSRPVSRANQDIQGLGLDKRKSNDDAFKLAMEAVVAEDRGVGRASLQREDEMVLLDGANDVMPSDEQPKTSDQGEDVDLGTSVNWDRGNWRSGGRDIFAVSQHAL